MVRPSVGAPLKLIKHPTTINVVTLNVVALNVITLNVVALNVVLLNVVRLNVVRLNVVRLIFRAPLKLIKHLTTVNKGYQLETTFVQSCLILLDSIWLHIIWSKLI